MEPKFTDYIVTIAKPRQDTRGAFIRHAREAIASGRFPEENSWAAILAMVENTYLADAGRRLWSEYRGYVKRTDYNSRAARGELPIRRLRALDPLKPSVHWDSVSVSPRRNV